MLLIQELSGQYSHTIHCTCEMRFYLTTVGYSSGVYTMRLPQPKAMPILLDRANTLVISPLCGVSEIIISEND